MITINFTRRVIIEQNGDVDEYISLRMQNEHAKAEAISQEWHPFRFFGSGASRTLAVSDGLSDDGPIWEAGEQDGHYLVAVQPRGNLEPGRTRTIGIHVRQEAGAVLSSDGVSLGNMSSFSELSNSKYRYSGMYVALSFPISNPIRTVVAENAFLCAGRTVFWRLPATMKDKFPIAARFLSGATSRSSSPVLVDGISELNNLIGQHAAGVHPNAVQVAFVSGLLARGLHAAGLASSVDLLKDLKNLHCLSHAESQACLLELEESVLRVYRHAAHSQTVGNRNEVSGHTVSVLLVCAPADEKYLVELENRLLPIERRGELKVWSRLRLTPGDDTEEQFEQHLQQADAVLFLMSADFRTDTLCSALVQKALLRTKTENLRVVPILLRPTTLDDEISRFQALPQGGVFISQSGDRDEAWLKVENKLTKLVTSLAHSKHHLTDASLYWDHALD